MLTGLRVMRADEVVTVVHLDTMNELAGQVLEMMLQLPCARRVHCGTLMHTSRERQRASRCTDKLVALS